MRACSEGTILLPLPPALPSITDCLHRVLAPTYKVLAQTRESIASGRQKELAEKMWEKAHASYVAAAPYNMFQIDNELESLTRECKEEMRKANG